MVVANPIGLTFPEWSAALVSDNGINIDPGRDEAQWQDWVASLNDAINAALPDPYVGWADWTQWAEMSTPLLETLSAVAPVAANSIGAAVALTFAGAGVASSQGLLSIWLFINPTGGTESGFRQGALPANRFIASWQDATTEFSIALAQTIGVNQFTGAATPGATITGQWSHLLINYDVGFAAGARIVQCAVNGVLVPVVPSVDIGAPITIPGVLSILMGGTAGYGCVGQVWYGMGQTLDLTVPGNIEKFVLPGPEPVDLGASGELPTGVSPDIYLNGEGVAFLTNLGTAGGTFAGGSGTCSSGSPP